MVILTIRTDKPEAEVGIYIDDTKAEYEVWLAHRELSVTIHRKIMAVLAADHKTLQDIGGIVCFAGPGSFTGLRIGLSVGNALAYSQNVPIVATRGSQWIQEGITKLLAGETMHIVMPEYGSPAHITMQKK